MDTQALRAVLAHHFASRHDIFHVVTGPKRETWFSAESIAALTKVQDGNSLLRISGEESWRKVYQSIKMVTPEDERGLSAIPDITAIRFDDDIALEWLAEVKLIDDWEFDLGNVSKGQDLETQLNRAKRFFPNVQAFGLIFAVHVSGRGDEDFRRHRAELKAAREKRTGLRELLKSTAIGSSEYALLLHKYTESSGQVMILEQRLEEELNAHDAELTEGLEVSDAGRVFPFLEFLQSRVERLLDIGDSPATATHSWVGGEGFQILGDLREVDPLSGNWNGNVSVALGIVQRIVDSTY